MTQRSFQFVSPTSETCLHSSLACVTGNSLSAIGVSKGLENEKRFDDQQT